MMMQMEVLRLSSLHKHADRDPEDMCPPELGSVRKKIIFEDSGRKG